MIGTPLVCGILRYSSIGSSLAVLKPHYTDDPTRDLYNRAINEPTSLADDERRILAAHPPSPEEYRLVPKVSCEFKATKCTLTSVYYLVKSNLCPDDQEGF